MRRARAVMPGGVSSPVRAYGSVGGTPVVLVRGAGARVVDADGRDYIDYVCSWGALLLGHAAPPVVAAVQAAAAEGTSFGALTPREIELAELVLAHMPQLERVRFVNSGSEATMSALRLARAATGRLAVLKFAGCYHGHSDAFLVQAGSGIATLGLPDSPGVPPELAALTLVAPYNDLAAAERVVDGRSDLAAVIVEAVTGNMGVVPPAPGFLQGLRALCDRTGALLIIDEVITGFRLHSGGAQTLLGVRADLTCMGKVMGGGLPAAAYAGSAALMEQLAPTGPVYQAGTLAGNPLAMAAGIATLAQIDARPDAGPIAAAERAAARISEGMESAAARHRVPLRVQRVGSMFTPFFSSQPVTDYQSAKRSDAAAYARWFHALLRRGVHAPPSPFETWFASSVHGDAEVEATLRAVDGAMAEVAT